MVVYGPWLTRAVAVVVLLLTLGFVRLDQPRIPRMPQVGRVRKIFLTLNARYRGRRDGKLGIPHPNDDKPPPEIWNIKQQGDAQVRRVASTWASANARLTGEIEAIKGEIVAVVRQIDVFNETGAELRKRVEARREQLLKRKAQDEKRHHDDRWRIRTWFYVPAMLVIFAGEFPLNAVAFNLFGEERWATYAMTAGLAAVLVFCAHGLGVQLRLRTMTDRDVGISVLLVALPVFLILAIGIVREQYLEALGQSGAGLAILGFYEGVGIFVVMNLVIYLGAFVLSYLHHDPYGEMIERVEREVRSATRAVNRHERKTERARGLVRWLDTKVSLWVGAREQTHRQAVYEGRREKDLFESFMEAYWGSNTVASLRAIRSQEKRARRRGEKLRISSTDWKPSAVRSNPPKIQLPPEFDGRAVEFRPEDLLRAPPPTGDRTDDSREAAEPPIHAT